MSDNSHVIAGTIQLLHPLLSLRSTQWIFYLALKRYSFCLDPGFLRPPFFLQFPTEMLLKVRSLGFGLDS